jgi:hypothetical protein
VSDNKDAKPPKASGIATALKDSLDAFAPVIDEGTVLRFDVNFKPEEPASHDYTYVALFVANKWWVSGQADAFGRNGLTNMQFMSKLGEYGAHNIELATEFAVVR